MKTPKKIHNSSHRQYRTLCQARQGEVAFQIMLAESDIRIVTCNTAPHLPSRMLETLGKLRADIQGWTHLYPEFRTSLSPLPIPTHAPQIIMRMCQAAQKAHVGPFAAVAGSIAQMLAEAHPAPNIIVENGGDVYMVSQKERLVALLADPTSGVSMGLQLSHDAFPVALCASSATIGHSLSLGHGDLAVVRAKDAALADAVATALGNRVRSAATTQDALHFGQNIAGVDGLFVQCHATIGVWGNMELVAL